MEYRRVGAVIMVAMLAVSGQHAAEANPPSEKTPGFTPKIMAPSLH